jgi:porphobilinogen synthase
MKFPTARLRRLRSSEALRALVRETKVSVDDLMAPIFVVPGKKVRTPISSLPGQFHFSPDEAAEQCRRLRDLGIRSVLLFGIPESKDEIGSAACAENGIVQSASRLIKQAVPDLLLTADLCYCEYTSHGHCGIIRDQDVDNDATLKILQDQALSLARAGIDILAPSGMMDGVVAALRSALDENNFEMLPILGYSAKFASSYYGPFREAVDSAPAFGDRRTYQMDPANTEEALREVALDIEEGADMVMVKPALAFLDIIAAVKQRFQMPTAAYNVSGEYAMIKAAAEKGWIDGKAAMLETLLSIKRAGADIIISYFAEEFARIQKSH